MILPTKGLSPRRCLLNVGAEVLTHLDRPKPIGRLWTDLSKEERHAALTYPWFVLALDMLFALDLVTMRGNRVERHRPEASS